MESFSLGTPALVCRWRLQEGRLPLENRHLRALSNRKVNGVPVTNELVAWAKQHIEWTLGEGASEYPDGVLLLVIDVGGQAAMSVGAYRPLERMRVQEALTRARGSRREGEVTGVSPEDLWLIRGDTLVWGISPELKPAGASSLINDLAQTLGMSVRRDEDILEAEDLFDLKADEVFLVSDEHGVVPARDCMGTRSKKFAAGYQKLLKTRR